MYLAIKSMSKRFLYFPGPDFVTSVEDGDYVYFFFREQAVEYINCGKVIFYRLKPLLLLLEFVLLLRRNCARLSNLNPFFPSFLLWNSECEPTLPSRFKLCSAALPRAI